MHAFLLVGCGAVGLAIGSFLNVVIHRVPKGESIVRPRSRCPSCGTEITPRDNVPVLSWLALRGKCRHCGEPISPRYPLVEFLTAALFVLTAARFGIRPELPAYLVFVAADVALAAIDLDTFTLPRKIVWPLFGTSVVLLAIAAVVDGDVDHARDAAVGSAIAFGVLFLVHVISPRGMGFGDVRLAAVLGLFLGWLELGAVAVGLFLSFLLASVVGVALIVAGRRGRKDRIPFGPFLLAGTYVAFFVAKPLLDGYLGR